jgi:hypothetical protein
MPKPRCLPSCLKTNGAQGEAGQVLVWDGSDPEKRFLAGHRARSASKGRGLSAWKIVKPVIKPLAPFSYKVFPGPKRFKRYETVKVWRRLTTWK